MIYLGGGGSSTDEAAVFAAAFQPLARIAIWPWAQPSHRWDGMISWIQSSVEPLGSFPPVTIGHAPDFGLDTADIIVIPGGNTFLLLQEMQQYGLIGRLREFVSKGGRVYGGSAGAVIQGADIGIIDEGSGGMDVNEGVVDLRGLDFLSGWVVFPHYGEEWKDHCERWSREKGVCVLGIAERGGLEVDTRDGRAVNLGPEDIWMFGSGRMEKWGAGEERVLRTGM